MSERATETVHLRPVRLPGRASDGLEPSTPSLPWRGRRRTAGRLLLIGYACGWPLQYLQLLTCC